MSHVERTMRTNIVLFEAVLSEKEFMLIGI